MTQAAVAAASVRRAPLAMMSRTRRRDDLERTTRGSATLAALRSRPETHRVLVQLRCSFNRGLASQTQMVHRGGVRVTFQKTKTGDLMMRLIALTLCLVTFWTSNITLAGARQEAKVLMPSDPAALKIEQDWGFSDALVD